jgi:hypothetical protein
MRRRYTESVNLRTGQQAGRAEHVPVPVGQSFTERIQALRAQAEREWAERGYGPPDKRVSLLVCDGLGCGARADVDIMNPEYPAGWEETGDGDLCPACRLAGKIVLGGD